MSHLNKNTRQAFTIMELLIVVAVIGILSTIGVVSYSGYQKRAKTSLVTFAAKEAAGAVKIAQMADKALPDTLELSGASLDENVQYDYVKDGEVFCVLASHVSDNTIKAGYGTYDNCGSIKAEYYNNRFLSGDPVLSRIEGAPPSVGTTTSPVPGEINNDDFSVRWTGYLTAPVSGTYTIYISGDDFVYFFKDNVLEISGGVGQGGEISKSFNFYAGQKIPIKMTMVEYGGYAEARIQWSYPGQSKQTIPGAYISP